jgi:hypothetical protein
MDVVATLPVHHFDADVYGRMVASGALDGEPVELLDGVLCEMSPQSPVHALIIQVLTRHFARAQSWLRVQLPLEVAMDVPRFGGHGFFRRPWWPLMGCCS